MGMSDVTIAFLDPENVDFDVLYAILLTFCITLLCVMVLMAAILENGAVCESHTLPTMSSRSFVTSTPQWLVLDMQTNVGIRLPVPSCFGGLRCSTISKFCLLPARLYASAVFARATCLSVRLSVRHAPVLCLHHHPTILFFWCQISSRHSKGFPRAGASNKGELGKISSFLSLSLNISKTVADTAKLQLTTNRKSHMGFPLTPRSWMTLICYKVKLYRNFAWFRDFGRQQNG